MGRGGREGRPRRPRRPRQGRDAGPRVSPQADPVELGDARRRRRAPRTQCAPARAGGDLRPGWQGRLPLVGDHERRARLGGGRPRDRDGDPAPQGRQRRARSADRGAARRGAPHLQDGGCPCDRCARLRYQDRAAGRQDHGPGKCLGGHREAAGLRLRRHRRRGRPHRGSGGRRPAPPTPTGSPPT